MNDSTDGELLQAYRATGDQDAFGVLMRRHGQMVLGAAKSVLGKESDAQDIAQATFMTLARKADALESSDSVVGWLYCVAVRLARNEVRGQIRRTERETEAAMLSDGPGESSGLLEGALSALHEELAQLSEKYRQPVLLHHVEGLSYEAGARLCGCTEKAFSVRLSRARDQLRERLARRGVTLGITALVAGLGQSASAAELPAGFVASTCAAAGGGAVSAQVSALMESALKLLFWAKVKTVTAACVVAVLVVGAGVGAAITLPLILHQEATPALGPAGNGSRVYAWGANTFGQLGDGTTNNSPTPVPVLGLDDVVAVAAGIQHTVALKSDQTVWAWGDNRYGQLGNGTTNSSSMPVAVPGLDGVIAVAAGAGHTVALKGDQTVWAWGNNRHGQLGNGTTNNSLMPVAVLGLDSVIAVAAGSTHTVAVKSDGTVWAWGNNGSGQLGDGTTTPQLAPAQVRMKDGSPLTGAIAVAAGDRHTAALRGDHTVWAWGDNAYGAVGRFDNDQGPLKPVVNPVPVPDIAGVTAIAAGRHHTLALADGGAVWTWGSYYAVGSPIYAPKLVKTAAGGPLSGITAIVAGDGHGVALKSDGTIWSWGQNVFGQLGDGTTVTAATMGREAPPAGAIVLMLDGRPSAGVTAIAAGRGHTAIVVGAREESVGVLE